VSIAFPDDRSYSMGHPAVLADVLAVRDHARTDDATTAHTLLSKQIWFVLRALGVTRGRMLVRGLDPEILAGTPPHQQALHPGKFGQLEGDIPRPGAHRDQVLVEFDPGYSPAVFDVVLLNTPYSDVVHHDGKFRLERWREHNQDLLSSLAYTAPGGLVAALVSADVLDAADPAPRRGMAVLADLLGAVRLPGGSLRNVPGCDDPVDLLFLRRRTEDQPTRGARFETSVQVQLDGGLVRLNEYFHTRIQDVLGRPALRSMPFGPPRLTVEPDPVSQHLDLDLGISLQDIVRTATAQGLTADNTTTSTPPGSAADTGTRSTGPARQGLRSPESEVGLDPPNPAL